MILWLVVAASIILARFAVDVACTTVVGASIILAFFCGLYYCSIVAGASDGDIACKSNTATDHSGANNQTVSKFDLND